ncbi:BON domain-containing protein [Paraflavisolibacter sp. H34]|uniref:BON domain-containing protein n=1 Tax=Huijunlia imazamoxiresistens TaxID=3127457 RepID=UPI00301888BD
MKHFIPKAYAIALLLTAGVQLTSCKSGPKDSDLQTAVNDKLRADPDYANISASVKEGVVTLNGTATNPETKNEASEDVREVKGVKNVVDNITVATPVAPAPVEIATDDALKTGVADAVKDYPGVTATVNNGEVTLTGDIKRDRLPNLMQSLHALHPKKINQNLTVK